MSNSQCNVNSGLAHDIEAWRDFVALCRKRGTTAAAVIRELVYSSLAYGHIPHRPVPKRFRRKLTNYA